MIPELDENGYLPPGVHLAHLDEIAARFGGQSEIRQVQMQSLGWLVDLAKQAGITRLVINGSFVTDDLEPNDVDCILLVGEKLPEDSAVLVELRSGLPFLETILVRQLDFDYLLRFFGTDRKRNPKGLVEVIL